jgi:hypothetical protein
MQCSVFVGSIFLFFFTSTVVQVSRAAPAFDSDYPAATAMEYTLGACPYENKPESPTVAHSESITPTEADPCPESLAPPLRLHDVVGRLRGHDGPVCLYV